MWRSGPPVCGRVVHQGLVPHRHSQPRRRRSGGRAILSPPPPYDIPLCGAWSPLDWTASCSAAGWISGTHRPCLLPGHGRGLANRSGGWYPAALCAKEGIQPKEPARRRGSAGEADRPRRPAVGSGISKNSESTPGENVHPFPAGGFLVRQYFEVKIVQAAERACCL